MDCVSPAPRPAAPSNSPKDDDTEHLLAALTRAASDYALRGSRHRRAQREDLLSALKYLVENVESRAGEPCAARVVLERDVEYEIYQSE